MKRSKRGYIFLCLFAIFLVSISFVSSASTSLVVKTAPYHDVRVTIAEDSEDYSVIERLTKKESDKNGNANFVFETNKDSVKLYIQINFGSEKLVVEEFEGVETGELIEYEVYPEGYTPKNKVETNENISLEDEVKINETIENLSDNITTIEGGADSIDSQNEE